MLSVAFPAVAEDGYRLWLRYDRLADDALRYEYATTLGQIILATPGGAESPTIAAARAELAEGWRGLIGAEIPIALERTAAPVADAGDEGYELRAIMRAVGPGGVVGGPRSVRIAANTDAGALYGAFAFLRHVQLQRSLDHVAVTSAPRIQRRLLNHWDNLNRFVERGYAGFSLWEWFYLPDIRSARYRDYARAMASLGLNGAALTNVNANALVLTPHYLEKVAALADEFRPYGIRVYLTARFSAPMEIGGLATADPLEAGVIAWWRAKVDEIYRAIPDFGGFLVKANSEGQPGPHEYGRDHAQGANLLADALAPHGGIVIWRAFVYAAENTEDRVKQAYTQFTALDGQFRDNAMLQIKNGPLDFMPREPFHPLFGAMPRTRLAPELQLAQEYLGLSVHLAFLAPMWREFFDADTHARGAGATVARVVDGSLAADAPTRLTLIAGVSNLGHDRNWTGHHLAQANWYAFGRLAWDHALTSEAIAAEWTRLTFGHDPEVVNTLAAMLLGSRETIVNFSMPLGLHHIMAEGHHHGPGPWVTHARADWGSPYYHQADELGLGAARSAGGSNAIAQYAPELGQLWGNLATCPEDLLLWFHHVPWDHRMKSGRTLWDELCLRYQQGVEETRALVRDWASLAGRIDAQRHTEVAARLRRQEADACHWRDACLLYFQTFSKRPLPAGVEPPAHDLEHYKAIKLRYVPGHPGDY